MGIEGKPQRQKRVGFTNPGRANGTCCRISTPVGEWKETAQRIKLERKMKQTLGGQPPQKEFAGMRRAD